MSERLLVLATERVSNPHVLPIFDALRREPGLDFHGCIYQALPGYRRDLGWRDIPPDAPYLQPWRRAVDRRRYHELRRSADVAIWVGVKWPGIVGSVRSRSRRGLPTIFWAERFYAKKKRSWLNELGVRGALWAMNRPHVHLMALGHGTEVEYRRFGATRWIAWRFGYAVEPVEPLTHSLAPMPSGELRILYVGALRQIKGVDVLLRALGEHRMRAAPWRLTVVGAGKRDAELSTLAARLGIADRITWVGAVAQDATDPYFAAADVLVLPSYTDGWGAVINEAMERGLAVVASDGVGAAPVLLDEARSGFVFPRGNATALAERLLLLCNDPERCGKMRAAARERIAMFRPAEAARRAAALIRGIAGVAPLPEFMDGLCTRL